MGHGGISMTISYIGLLQDGGKTFIRCVGVL